MLRIPPKRPNQGGAVSGATPNVAGAGGPVRAEDPSQSQPSSLLETGSEDDGVPVKKRPSVLFQVSKIILGFGLLFALAWFVVMPLLDLGGSSYLFSRDAAAPLPMVKPDPESLKVEGLKLEKGEVLTALTGTLKNTGSSTFRNVKITFRMTNSDNNPEEFSHTVNQELSAGVSVKFSASITFEPSDGAMPEVVNIDSDEQLAQ